MVSLVGTRVDREVKTHETEAIKNDFLNILPEIQDDIRIAKSRDSDLSFFILTRQLPTTKWKVAICIREKATGHFGTPTNEFVSIESDMQDDLKARNFINRTIRKLLKDHDIKTGRLPHVQQHRLTAERIIQFFEQNVGCPNENTDYFAIETSSRALSRYTILEITLKKRTVLYQLVGSTKGKIPKLFKETLKAMEDRFKLTVVESIANKVDLELPKSKKRKEID